MALPAAGNPASRLCVARDSPPRSPPIASWKAGRYSGEPAPLCWQLRVATYNIHSGMSLEEDALSPERTAQAVTGAQPAAPQVLCLQEVEVVGGAIPQRTRKWSRLHAEDQVAAMATATGLQHTLWAPALRSVAFDPTASSAGDEVLVADEQGGDYGIAILSSLPFEDQRVLNFDGAPSAGAVLHMDRVTQPRGAAAVLVRTHPAAAPVWVVTTHLSHKSGSGEQKAQARQLCEWCDKLRQETADVAAGMILCGDMNSPPIGHSQPGAGAWAEITAWLPSQGHPRATQTEWSDAWLLSSAVRSGGDGGSDGGGHTCPSDRPRYRIDQFFLDRTLASHAAQVAVEVGGTTDPHASDHLPVHLTVTVGAAPSQAAGGSRL